MPTHEAGKFIVPAETLAITTTTKGERPTILTSSPVYNTWSEQPEEPRPGTSVYLGCLTEADLTTAARGKGSTGAEADRIRAIPFGTSCTTYSRTQRDRKDLSPARKTGHLENYNTKTHLLISFTAPEGHLASIWDQCIWGAQRPGRPADPDHKELATHEKEHGNMTSRKPGSQELTIGEKRAWEIRERVPEETREKMRDEANAYRHIGPNPGQRQHAGSRAPEKSLHGDLNQVAKNAEEAHLVLEAGFSQKELQQKTKPKTREAEYNREGRFQEVTAAREKELNLETVWTRRKHRLAPGLSRRSLPKKALRKRLNPTELELVVLGALTEVNLPDARKAERYPERVGGAAAVELLAPVMVSNSGAESSGAKAERAGGSRKGSEPPELSAIKAPADTVRKCTPRANQTALVAAAVELLALVIASNSGAKSSGVSAERAGCSRKGSEPPELSAMKAPADTVRKCTPRTNQTASAELCAPVPYPTHGQKLGGKKVLATVPSSTSRSSSGNGVLSTNDMAEFTRFSGG